MTAASTGQQLNGGSIARRFRCQDNVMVLEFLETVGILQEQSKDEFVDRLFRVVQNLFGLGHACGEDLDLLVEVVRPESCEGIVIDDCLGFDSDAITQLPLS
jgi:hypothetical protein